MEERMWFPTVFTMPHFCLQAMRSGENAFPNKIWVTEPIRNSARPEIQEKEDLPLFMQKTTMTVEMPSDSSVGRTADLRVFAK